MPFALAGAAITAGAGLIGASKQASATKGAADQAQATLDQQRNDLAPFRTAGGAALGVASDLSGANGPDAATAAMANFHTDPGYQFQLDQGLRAVGAHQAAAGMFDSGATEKAQITFAGGLADQSFQNYYNRLYGLANMGETAAGGGAATAGTAATLAQGAGNTQASIFGNAASGLGTTLGSALSNPKVQNALSPSPDIGTFDPFQGNTLQ